MIITLKTGTTDKQVEELVNNIKEKGFGVHLSKGENLTIIGLLGDTSGIETEQFEVYPIVDKVKRISAPYKMASRAFHPEDSVIKV